MGKYWSEASELCFRRPILWVPVLVGDLLGSGLNVAEQAIVRAIVLHKMAYHSVLGGTVQQHGLTMQQAQQASEIAVPFAWTGYFLRILCYVIALIVTASLVWNEDRRDAWAKAFGDVWARMSGTVFLALRVLAVYAFAAVGFSYLMTALSKAHSPLANAQWVHFVSAAVLVLLLVAIAAAAGLRLLVQGPPSEHATRSARFMALLMGLVSLTLQFFVGQSGGVLLHATEGRRLTMEILASLLTAVPYILLYVGYGVISAVERRDADDADVPAVPAEV